MAQPLTCLTQFWEAELRTWHFFGKSVAFLARKATLAICVGGPWLAGPQFAFIDQ